MVLLTLKVADPWTSWMEAVLIRQCFMRHSTFEHTLNLQLWMDNIHLKKQLCIESLLMI